MWKNFAGIFFPSQLALRSHRQSSSMAIQTLPFCFRDFRSFLNVYEGICAHTHKERRVGDDEEQEVQLGKEKERSLFRFCLLQTR